tara:strand:+ start:22437 stop:22622 length:186 start_codon:yes stop_codon:yes gene_type:complete
MPENMYEILMCMQHLLIERREEQEVTYDNRFKEVGILSERNEPRFERTYRNYQRKTGKDGK